jgi:hypothetical protein
MEDGLERWGDRQERAAHNQSLFRAVNQELKRLIGDWGLAPDFGAVPVEREWICECANAGCMERIALTDQEYDIVRSVASRFAVAPDAAHFFADVEDLCEEHDGHWVVEKSGKARTIAERLSERITL